MTTHTRNIVSIDIGEKHYAICALDLTREPSTSIRLVYLNTLTLGLPQACPVSGRIDRLVQIWNTMEFLKTWQPDTILIEQQMQRAYANSALSFATYTWFHMRYPTAMVRFVKPSFKLTSWKQYVPEVALQASLLDLETQSKSPSGYYARKKLAILLADLLLEHFGIPNLAHYATACGGKKDDLADAFLQAFCS